MAIYYYEDQNGKYSSHTDARRFSRVSGKEAYAYVKTGNGKRIDFALRNPQRIKKIDSYELPTDDELMLQSIDAIICETCYLNEHCSGYCVLSKQKKVLRQSMLDILKSDGEE